MTTQGKQPDKLYRTRIVSIEAVDRQGHAREKPILVFPDGVGPSKKFGFRGAVDPETARLFKAGDAVVLGIDRGGPKVADPKWDTDYYWNVVKLEHDTGSAPKGAIPAYPTQASPQQPLAATGLPPHPADGPQVPPAQREGPSVQIFDSVEARKEDATNRRVALMQAVAALPSLNKVDWVGSEGHVVQQVARMAQGFYETLLTLHAPEPEAQP